VGDPPLRLRRLTHGQLMAHQAGMQEEGAVLRQGLRHRDVTLVRLMIPLRCASKQPGWDRWAALRFAHPTEESRNKRGPLPAGKRPFVVDSCEESN
jgi:hypothetical protein